MHAGQATDGSSIPPSYVSGGSTTPLLGMTIGDCFDATVRALQKLPDLRAIIQIGETTTSGLLSFEEVCRRGSSVPPPSVKLRFDEPINIQFMHDRRSQRRHAHAS
jgi:hypothetical protein